MARLLVLFSRTSTRIHKFASLNNKHYQCDISVNFVSFRPKTFSKQRCECNRYKLHGRMYDTFNNTTSTSCILSAAATRGRQSGNKVVLPCVAGVPFPVNCLSWHYDLSSIAPQCIECFNCHSKIITCIKFYSRICRFCSFLQVCRALHWQCIEVCIHLHASSMFFGLKCYDSQHSMLLK